MLSLLIKLRLKSIMATLFQTTKGKKKVNVGGNIVSIIAFAGIFVYLMYLMSTMFEPMAIVFSITSYDWLYFALAGLMAGLFILVGTVFLVQQEIYKPKDNDLLLSMPIKVRDIILSRVSSILILSYFYEAIIFLPAVYAYFTHVPIQALQVVNLVLVFVLLPLIILVLTSIVSYLLTLVINKSKMKNIMTLLFFMVGFGVYMFVVYNLNDLAQSFIENGASISQAIQQYMYPFYLIGTSIIDANMIDIMIFIAISVIPFALVMKLLSMNFVKMATTKEKTTKVKYEEKEMRVRSTLLSLLRRELKHFTSNASIMLNGAVGVFLSILAIVAVIFFKDTIVFTVEQIVQIEPDFADILLPLACIAVLYFTSTSVISAYSISIEGDRMYILKTLPVDAKAILWSKVLFHLLMVLPVQILLSLTISWVLSFSILQSVILVLVPAILVVFEGVVGILLNLWKYRFDWKNETVCVKRGFSVIISVLYPIVLLMVLFLLYTTTLDSFLSLETYLYSIFALFAVLDILAIVCLNTWGAKRFENIKV